MFFPAVTVMADSVLEQFPSPAARRELSEAHIRTSQSTGDRRCGIKVLFLAALYIVCGRHRGPSCAQTLVTEI